MADLSAAFDPDLVATNSDAASSALAEANTASAVAAAASSAIAAQSSSWEKVEGDTSPKLGGNLDLNEKGIAYDFASLASDHTYSGDVITAMAGQAVAIGDVCYFKSDGKFWKMDADAEATIKGMCVMATATIGVGANGVFLLRGLIRDNSWTWTVGAELWASCTPGNPTATKPSGSGDLLRLIGWAKHADYIWFDPDKTYVELS